ncbi:MAG: DUF502 domain-containing protein [Verrucomicrobiae bacterium]|nr:DUF502 domain-containing protein [Verrucomicrobiae bacterium]
MEHKGLIVRWRANFLAGLAIILPAVVSIAVIVWLFGSVSNITDALLFFLKYILNPERIYLNGKSGQMFWYWSLLALLLALGLVSIVGRLARNYIGKKLIQWMDNVLMRVPLVNKIYSTIKQVNEAFSTGKKSAFQTVVLIQFPRAGIYSLGFITGEQHDEVQQKTKEKVVCIFVPTTPNPTSGWLVLVPEQDVTRLQMSVADAIKFIISLGSVSPEYAAPAELPPISQPRTGVNLPA